MKGSVIIMGPANPLRGGLTTFNHRFAKAFLTAGYDCKIYSFSLQYPSFLFPGTTQYTAEPAPEGLTIRTRINSINPLNWLSVGRELRKARPDIILIRFWLPLMGPALGSIARIARSNKHSRIIALTDNIFPHEKRKGDFAFTKYFLGSCDAYITMSEKVMNDLRTLEKTKPARLVAHPLYDNFGQPIPKQEARSILRQKGLDIPDDQRVILFFGFIRKYKGLDILLEAMADPRIRQAGIKLLIAGEFYEEEQPYQEQIDRLGIRDLLYINTSFIPDSEVRNFLCAADAVIQPYRNASQSGVTPLAYHFEKPMVVTNVGGLQALVPHEEVGLVTKPEPHEIASAILRLYEKGIQQFIPCIQQEKTKYTWEKLVNAIEDVAAQIKKNN